MATVPIAVPVSGSPTIIVNAALATKKAALALERALCHWRGMEPRNMRAGGCFLMAAILIGFVGGIAIQNPLLGTWIGTGVGIAIAVVLWLVDRRSDS